MMCLTWNIFFNLQPCVISLNEICNRVLLMSVNILLIEKYFIIIQYRYVTCKTYGVPKI